MKVRLPTALQHFHRTVCDGFSFRWHADPDDDKSPFANLQVPTLN